MPCRKRNNVIGPCEEEWAGCHKKCPDRCLGQGREGHINLAFGACGQNLDLSPDDGSCPLDVRDLHLKATARAHEKGNRGGIRHQFLKQL